MLNVAVFNDTSLSGHYGCIAVMSNLKTILENNKINIKFLWPVGKDWRPHAKEISLNLKEIDAIIVNGEGSIHNSASRPRARYLSELAEFAQNELRIPSYLINATIYNNCPETYRMLRMYDYIFVRETTSKEDLYKNGIDSIVVPDLSLCTGTSYQDEVKITRSGFIVTGSTLRNVNEELERLSISRNFEFLNMYISKPRKGIRERLLNSLRKRLPSAEKSFKENVDFYNTHHEIVKKLSQAKAVITGRFHTVTLCLLTETPFLAIESNTPKINSLLSDVFSDTSRIITLNELRSTSNAVLAGKFQFSQNEKLRIKAYRQMQEKKMKQMISLVSNDILNHMTKSKED